MPVACSGLPFGVLAPLSASTVTLSQAASPPDHSQRVPTVNATGVSRGGNRWPRASPAPPALAIPALSTTEKQPEDVCNSDKSDSTNTGSTTAASVTQTGDAAAVFRRVLTEYYDACADTGDVLSAALAFSLSLPPRTATPNTATAAMVTDAAAAVAPLMRFLGRRGCSNAKDLAAGNMGDRPWDRAWERVPLAHSRRAHTLELKRYPDPARTRMGAAAHAALPTAAGRNAGAASAEYALAPLDSDSDDCSNPRSHNVISGSQAVGAGPVALRMPVHSDLSTLTFLLQSHDQGGLLVCDAGIGTKS